MHERRGAGVNHSRLDTSRNGLKATQQIEEGSRVPDMLVAEELAEEAEGIRAAPLARHGLLRRRQQAREGRREALPSLLLPTGAGRGDSLRR